MIDSPTNPHRDGPLRRLIFLLSSVLATRTCRAFVLRNHHFGTSGLRPSRLVTSYSANPFESESSADRGRRMQLVRELQRTFYANETGVSPPQHGVFREMPLWRGDWTELPGYQHVMNVTEPDYVNMLMKVVSSPRPWYFGHIFIPGGSDRINDEAFQLKHGSDAPLTGTLMQVSDYKQLDDGRLLVVVQALGRFLVVDASRHGSPYGIATVELLPDEEMVEAHFDEAEEAAASFDFAMNDDTRGAACAGAVAEAAEWHSYEFKPINAEDTMTKGGVVAPVANFNSGNAASGDTDNVHAAMEEYLSQSPTTMHHGECSLSDDSDEPLQERALDLEHDVWLELDTLATILSKLNPKANTEMPIPTQILGLLPASDPNRPWPKGFKLNRYKRKMSNVYSILGKNPKVNVDHQQLKTAEGYPALRRARRLSYVIWALLDTILDEEQEKQEGQSRKLTRQDILEMDSTTQRLEAAKSKVQRINDMLRQVLEQ